MTSSIIPPGKTFRDLKTASADFNRNGGDYDARLCYLLACIADGVARTAVNKCDAIAAATTAGALRRKATGSDPLQRARHIAAALNVGVMDFGFFWVTGVTMDGTLLVAQLPLSV